VPRVFGERLLVIAPIPVPVECHFGYRAYEYPTAVYVEGRRREVAEILDRWYEGAVDPESPAVRYFKVRTTEGPPLVLKHDPRHHAWYLMCELE
jgi:hypothetical protein